MPAPIKMQTNNRIFSLIVNLSNLSNPSIPSILKTPSWFSLNYSVAAEQGLYAWFLATEVLVEGHGMLRAATG